MWVRSPSEDFNRGPVLSGPSCLGRVVGGPPRRGLRESFPGGVNPSNWGSWYPGGGPGTKWSGPLVPPAQLSPFRHCKVESVRRKVLSDEVTQERPSPLCLFI